MRIQIRPYELALRTPLRTARSEIGSRAGLLLSLCDGVRTGWGETAPMPGWSAHDLQAVTEALGSAAGEVGSAAELTEESLAGSLERLDAVPEARAALAGAYADLRARRAGLPLAAWLARSPLDDDGSLGSQSSRGTGLGSVAVSEVIADPDPEAAGEAARRAVAKGIGCLKVKVAAAAHEADLARVAAVRVAAGPDTELRLDANGAWPPDRAAGLLDAFADLDIAFCEEPTAGIEEIAAVGAAASIPVAVDESARTLAHIAAALRSESIAAVVVKPQALGGPDLAMAAIGLIRRHGAIPIVSTMIDSAVGVAHAVHVAAACDALGAAPAAHGLGTSALLAEDVADPLPVIGGRIVVGADPGLGTVPR